MFLDSVSKLSVARYNAWIHSRDEADRLAEAVEGSKNRSTLRRNVLLKVVSGKDELQPVVGNLVATFLKLLQRLFMLGNAGWCLLRHYSGNNPLIQNLVRIFVRYRKRQI